MQVSVEAPNTLERRMTVIVPFEKIEEAYDKRISNLAKTAKLNGFRKGKIPLELVKQRYGDTARQEALSEVIQSSLYAAIHQEKLSPVGVPTVEPKSIMPGQPLEYIATFEVLPEVDAVRFEVIALEKHISTITELDIDNVLKHLRQQQAVWQTVDRAAQDQDQVVIDFRGSIDGKVFEGGEAHDYPIVLGSKTMIPGFEEGIIGLSTGEEKTISVTFPETYFAKEFSGKAAEFAIKIIKIAEPVLPELNDAFINKMGVKSGNLEDFRNEVRKNLEREMSRVIKAKMKQQVFDKLLEQNPLEIPKALIEREAKRIHDELHPHHAGQEHGHTDAEMATFNAAAKRNVALGLLIAKLIKQYNVLPSLERINSQIEHMAGVYENPAEVVKWYATNKRAKADVEMQVLEEQLVEVLLQNVQVTEKMMSYNELISGAIK